MRAQEVSMIHQLYGLESLHIREHTRGRDGRFLDQIEQDPSQGGTYVLMMVGGSLSCSKIPFNIILSNVINR